VAVEPQLSVGIVGAKLRAAASLCIASTDTVAFQMQVLSGIMSMWIIHDGTMPKS
jgi:hypothetical protein